MKDFERRYSTYIFISEYEAEEQPAMKLTDMLPRADISSQITEALLAEISDKNWKTRNEGLTKLQSE